MGTDGGEPLYPPLQGTVASDPEARIAAVYRGKPDGDKPGLLRIIFDRSGAVLTSVDDGASWSAASPIKAIASSADAWAADMAVDAADERHIAVAARTTAQVSNPKDENGGIFESWDGGATWENLTAALRPGAK